MPFCRIENSTIFLPSGGTEALTWPLQLSSLFRDVVCGMCIMRLVQPGVKGLDLSCLGILSAGNGGLALLPVDL